MEPLDLIEHPKATEDRVLESGRSRREGLKGRSKYVVNMVWNLKIILPES